MFYLRIALLTLFFTNVYSYTCSDFVVMKYLKRIIYNDPVLCSPHRRRAPASCPRTTSWPTTGSPTPPMSARCSVTCHMSRVTCHALQVTCHVSLTWTKSRTRRWRWAPCSSRGAAPWRYPSVADPGHIIIIITSSIYLLLILYIY